MSDNEVEPLPTIPAKWEYTSRESHDPLENQAEWLNEMAADGWRLVGIWDFKNLTAEMGSYPCAKFFFERENPEYIKALERQRRSDRRPLRRTTITNNFISANARRETWRSLDRMELK